MSDEKSAEEIAAELTERYTGSYNDRGYGSDYAGTDEFQKVPWVAGRDPPVFMVKCKVGREKDIVVEVARYCLANLYAQDSGGGEQILTCFSRKSLPGYLYIESHSKAHVLSVLSKINNVYLGPDKNKITLLEDRDMEGVLRVERSKPKVKVGDWVRVRRPAKYAGDLAKVVSLSEDGDSCTLRMLPRLEPYSADSQKKDKDANGAGAKRKKGTIRPIAKLFNAEDWPRSMVQKLPNGQRRLTHVAETFDSQGYRLKRILLNAVEAPIADPTLDEIQTYLGGSLDLSNLDRAGVGVGKATVSDFIVGEEVEVTGGQLTGMVGKVEKFEGGAVVVKLDNLEDLNPFPPNDLRKRFHTGDHVRVTAGQFAPQTGSVLKIVGTVATLLTDVTNREIEVFTKDLRLAAEVVGEASVAGGRALNGAQSRFDVFDLVQIDYQTVGCITHLAADAAVLVDQYGNSKRVPVSLLTQKKDTSRAVATDAQGQPLAAGDTVFVSPASTAPGGVRRANVVHVYKDVVFCQSKEVVENGGVFVVPSADLTVQSRAGGRGPGMGSMGPPPLPAASRAGNGPGSVAPVTGRGGFGGGGRGRRDPLVGRHVVIQGGAYKGYQGVVKDAAEITVRVELHTNARVVSVDRQKVVTLGADGRPDNSGFGTSYGGFSGGQTPSYGGARTPSYGGSRTPGYGGGRTPAWDGARTPGGGWGGSKTPAWDSGARTPGRDTSGAKTPAWDSGSRTPGRFVGDGSRTPAWNAMSDFDSRPGTGGTERGDRPMSVSDTRGQGYGGYSRAGTVATPYLRPPDTPGVAGTVGTPGPSGDYGTPYAPQTPAAYPQTPLPYELNAPTPAATPGGVPQTPGAYPSMGSVAATAPTPHNPATPAALGGSYGMSSVGGAGAPSEWELQTEVEVRIRSPGSPFHGLRGVTRRVDTSARVCGVVLLEGPRVNEIEVFPNSSLELVVPVKKDEVKVLSGQDKGNIGSLIGIDGKDGLVRMKGRVQIVMIALSDLGKLFTG
ncbi:hypothetical protein M427DRAFT_450983 [Gonapodya prolifera JEL478]|uniref:Transcription elongation factor SPT5 n=1 Tax=Gonapodya prolifera (strain JEL478) TaxID=1344416 RepID=A0A139ASD6_GONPJ|nr:hypothetical protein M427DRAFT_450983 [Gonapodya prolifera JEL478]|eukprot:KXS19453.1 hypothetical protein M427DRAFT_450983 [Gonapodya prolifera JEL478]